MLKNVLFIAKKDFFYSLKEKTLLLWMFIMPLVFFGFIGSTTGGFAKNSGKPLNIAIWEEQVGSSQSSALVKQILYRLQQENFNTVIFNAKRDAEKSKYHFEDYTRKLWLPKNLDKKLIVGEKIEIKYETQASDLQQGRDKFNIEKAIYQTLGDVLIFKTQNHSLKNLGFKDINNRINSIQVEVSSAGEKLNIPSGFNQAVPGILVMFIMMIALTNGALSIFLERQSGVLKRLAATPLTRNEIVMGKWFGKWFITLLQLIYGMIVGWLIFKIHWGSHLVSVVLVLLLWSALAAAFAVLLGSIGKSEGQVNAIANITPLVLAAMGGCWWPIEITPQWVQNFANFLPTGWIMDALHQLMFFGGKLLDVIPQISAMVVLTLVALILGFKKFKFS